MGGVLACGLIFECSSVFDDIDNDIPESAADDIPGSNTLPDSESKKIDV